MNKLCPPPYKQRVGGSIPSTPTDYQRVISVSGVTLFYLPKNLPKVTLWGVTSKEDFVLKDFNRRLRLLKFTHGVS